MRTARSLVVLGVAVSLSLAACTGSSSHTEGTENVSATTAVPTATTSPPECNNATSSFAPTGAELATAPGGYLLKIRNRGRLVAGVSADTLLFGYRNPLSGKLEGFDVDLVRAVAKQIFGDANRISYKVVTYAQRIPALQSGEVDIVADVMTINCTRWTQINFSSEYLTAGQKILVRTDSSAKSIADLDGKKVCVAKGSTNFEEMKNYPKVIAVGVDDISDCMVLFQQGAVDSVTGDDTVLAGFVAQDPYAKIVGPKITTEPYGLGIAQGHPEFVRYVNAILQRMRVDGTWKQMYRKWLQPTGTLPSPPPAVYGRNP